MGIFALDLELIKRDVEGQNRPLPTYDQSEEERFQQRTRGDEYVTLISDQIRERGNASSMSSQSVGTRRNSLGTLGIPSGTTIPGPRGTKVLARSEGALS